MSQQEYVGMKDLVFVSPTRLAARRASMLRDGIGFLPLSTDEADHNVLLVPIAQNDPLNNVVDQARKSGRFQCHVGFVPLLHSLILIISPLPFMVTWFRLWFARLRYLESKASRMGVRAYIGISA
jgi:hypothetical protein